MKYKIRTNSWHFWIACFLNVKNDVLEKETICSYRWCVIFGLARLLVVLNFAFWLLLMPIVVAITHFIIPKYWSQDAITTSYILLSIYVIITLLSLLIIWLVDYFQAHKKQKEMQILVAKQTGTYSGQGQQPSFVKTLWQSLKNKYCVAIEFDDSIDN